MNMSSKKNTKSKKTAIPLQKQPTTSDQDSTPEARMSDILPVLPLSDMVLFPSMIAPLVVTTERSMDLLNSAVSEGRYFICSLQIDRDKADDEIHPDEVNPYGCLARLVKLLKFPDDTLRVLVQGVERCLLTEFEISDNPRDYLRAKYTLLPDHPEDSLELAALNRNAKERFREIVALSQHLPEELGIAAFNMDEPGRLADLVATNINMSIEERQSFLEDAHPLSRLKRLTALLNRELEVLHLGSKIQTQVSESFAKNQREHVLREQLKAIQGELGEQNQQQIDVQEIGDKIKQSGMPNEVRSIAEKEKKRLLSIPAASPEYSVVRTYLDWLSEMPWSKETEDLLDISEAERVLNRDHYDLVKVKERILEYLAVLKLKKDLKGPILCFAGPPGVGKTSLGQSIARALGRKFVRMSLGGLHDEAEIRGHRRTYIGALPGRIIQELRKAGTRNPVFMLDEVDKIGQDFRGDPASALLEVLDPEQNFAFSDHYMDVPFDLSRVLFITTANQLDPIPPPLRDRMEVLELSGYTLLEKAHIARSFLVPKQIKAHGLKRKQLTFKKDAMEELIDHYTREAGVRNLEREIAHVCRKRARAVAEGRQTPYQVTRASLPRLLGPKKYQSEVAERRSEPGIVTGLAWTPVGGDILFLEASRMKGKGQMILTGSLGDVMKESARAALSYVRAHTKSLGIDPKVFVEEDLHIHVPAGAIPKDGPSAGLAMAIGLISLYTRQSVSPSTAMTGEITLRGRVMPVGGLKEKLLAADRAGIRRVLLPSRNRNDIKDIPEEVKKRLEIRFVQTISGAIRIALEKEAENGNRPHE